MYLNYLLLQKKKGCTSFAGGKGVFIRIIVFWMLAFSGTLLSGQIFFEFSNEDMGILAPFFPKGGKLSPEKNDGEYTQGLFLSYTWKRFRKEHASIFLLQDLYSPSGSVKRESTAQRGSRPFASYSRLGGRYFWRGSYSSQRASFVAGFLGEDSFGGQMQSFFHKTFKGREGYEGWQDEVEGGVFVLGEYSAGLQKNFLCSGVCLAVIPSGTLTLGNLVTSLSLGGSIVFGQKERVNGDFLKSYSFLSGGSGFLAGKDF